ncbi:MAG: hypothetical protein Q9196_001294 [Gyalolechia fulgens]
MATTRSPEESIRTQFCDSPMPELSTSWDTVPKEAVGLGKYVSDGSRNGVCTSDRNELMERIKRGESPTWIPSQTLQEEYSKHNDKRQHSPLSSSGHCEPAPLLPAAHIEDESITDNGGYAQELSPPSEIKRPRSALHAGDFNKNSAAVATTLQQAPVPDLSTRTGAQAFLGTPPTTPWHTPSRPFQSPDLSPPASPFSGQPASYRPGMGRKRSNIDDEPSPYVGHIDLQNLPTPAESKKIRRSRSKSPPININSSRRSWDGVAADSIDNLVHTIRAQKKRRQASPTPSNLQGGYRIPQKGQLQIIIKNPNKNAVKLFLVPYDLDDMQAGTKTFIRQRCYSTEPVIDGLLAKPNPEHDLPGPGNPSMSKPTLRYLIHVNICSPSNGRYYLYQHIRVVFANRVPDNKEQLQTEIQVPQPRYSAYKPNFALSRSTSGASVTMARDKAGRKRSAGFGVGLNGMDDRHPRAFSHCETSYPPMLDSPPPPLVPGVPLRLSSAPITAEKRSPEIELTYNLDNDQHAGDGVAAPFPTYGGYPVSPGSTSSFRRLPTVKHQPRNNRPETRRPVQDQPMDIDIDSGPDPISRRILHSWLADESDQRILHSKSGNVSHSSNETFGRYSKLSKGAAGYGGRPSTPEPGEGLLARRLRGLGVRRETAEEDARREWDARNSGW